MCQTGWNYVPVYCKVFELSTLPCIIAVSNSAKLWLNSLKEISRSGKAADSHQQVPIIQGRLIFYTEQVENCAPGFCKAAELSAIPCAIAASNSARWCLNSSRWLLIFCRLTGSIFWGESGMHNWTLYFYKPKRSGSIFTTSRSQLNASGPWYWTLYF